MSIFQNSILSEAAAFGDTVALLDRASGGIVRYSDLPQFLASISGGLDFDHSSPVATWRANGFPTLAYCWLCSTETVWWHLSATACQSRGSEARWLDRSTILWTDEGALDVEGQRSRIDASGAGTILFTSGSSGSSAAVWHDLTPTYQTLKEQRSVCHSPRLWLAAFAAAPSCEWIFHPYSLPAGRSDGRLSRSRCVIEKSNRGSGGDPSFARRTSTAQTTLSRGLPFSICSRFSWEAGRLIPACR
jgi:hypothetical protein